MGGNRNNLRLVLRENIVYFVTLLACIALFYGFVSLGDINNPLIQGNKEYDFTMYAPMIRYCIYAVSVTIFILISYVNSHMFKEKLKDMSVLITLGMQRSKIALWYSKDMLKVSILSFLGGIFFGIGCSFGINSLISIIIYDEVLYADLIYANSFLETLIFFTVMYLGITFINIIKVLFWKPIDLLNNSKVPESKKISKLRKMIEIVLLTGCYFFIIYNFKVYFSIGRNYNGVVPSYESNKFQFAIFIAIITAIFLTIKIINYFLIWFKSCKNLLIGTSAVIIGKLSHRMKSNTKNMLIITIVLTLSLCGFSLIPLMAEFSNEYMEHRMIYDINIPFNYDNIEEITDIPDVDYTFVKSLFEEKRIEIENECILKEYFVWNTDFSGPSVRTNKYDMPRLAMGITDYNKLREMAGLEAITLEADYFLFHVKDDIDLTQLRKQLNDKGTHSIKVSGIILKEKPNDFLINENLGAYIYNTNTDSFLVFPDEVCKGLTVAKKGYFANTKNKIPYNLCKEIDRSIQEKFHIQYNDLYEKYEGTGNPGIDFIGPIRFRSIEENDISFMVIITKALGMYIGVVFMLICMAIISIKNIIECNSNIDNYYVMHQIGMPLKEVKFINLIENLFFYLMPYVISVVNFCIVQNTFLLRFGDRAKTYFHGNQYINSIFLPIVIISIILFAYILFTQIIIFYKIKKRLENI